MVEHFSAAAAHIGVEGHTTMSFHPGKLPLPMQKAWLMGPSYWRELVRAAADTGLYDVDFVTSAVFYLWHPERRCRPIERNEIGLAAEWKSWRVQVDSLLRSRPRNSAPNIHSVPNIHEVVVTKATD